MRRKEAMRRISEAETSARLNERSIQELYRQEDRERRERTTRLVRREMDALSRRNAELTTELRQLRLLAHLTLGVEEPTTFPAARVKAAVQNVADGCTVLVVHSLLTDEVTATVIRPGREVAPWQRGKE